MDDSTGNGAGDGPGRTPLRIALLGGTGPLGRGLALRFAAAGHDCVLGSRSVDRAEAAAGEVRERAGRSVVGTLAGAPNAAAAAGADLVVVSVPYPAMAPTLRDVADQVDGSIVVSCVNALAFDAGGPRPRQVEAGSAAQECAQLLPGARVVGAFHHVAAGTLLEPGRPLEADVLIVGDDDAANQVVAGLVAQIAGARPVLAGPLRLAAPIEDLTAVLISVNKRYGTHAGISVTDLPV